MADGAHVERARVDKTTVTLRTFPNSRFQRVISNRELGEWVGNFLDLPSNEAGEFLGVVNSDDLAYAVPRHRAVEMKLRLRWMSKAEVELRCFKTDLEDVIRDRLGANEAIATPRLSTLPALNPQGDRSAREAALLTSTCCIPMPSPSIPTDDCLLVRVCRVLSARTVR